ncbi:MAG: SH3 domain-containing protein [Chloroflexi bacterium]|nr:SH3 domain-containing protein [Chloroflexota bacterium]
MRRTLCGLILIVTLILLGIAQADTNAQGENILRVGYAGQPDDDMARGMTLAAQQVNSAGGVTAPDDRDYTYEILYPETPITDPADIGGVLTSLANSGAIAIFGPNDPELVNPVIPVLTNAQVPVLTGVTNDALFSQDENNNIFRAVPPERLYGLAMVDYLANQGAQSLVIVRQGVAWNDAVTGLRFTLQDYQLTTEFIIEVEEIEDALLRVSEIGALEVDAVIMYSSSAEDSASFFGALRGIGWTGIFVHRTAQELLSGTITNGSTEGIIGAATWTYGAEDTLSRTFVAQYVAEFGNVPGPLAAAGYDMFFALNRVIRDNGPEVAAVRTGLAGLSGLTLVRGEINPAGGPESDMSRTVYIYALTGKGGARAVAVYSNGILVEEGEEPVAGDPTSTPSPTATEEVVGPTATPQNVTITVDVPTLNVRSGPGTEFPVITQINEGEQYPVAGRSQDFLWYLIQVEGRLGWVSADLVTVFDPGGLLALLPIISAATPTVGVTAAPQSADLIINNVTLNPAVPQPGCQFTATVTVLNQGASAAGFFGVATTFIPGNQATFTGTNLQGLGPNATITAQLTQTINQSAYVPGLAYVVDINNEVNEGQNGEANNTFNAPFKIDKPVLQTATATVNANTPFDFFGGTPDMNWNTSNSNLEMQGGGQIGLVSNTPYENVHYDQVASTTKDNSHFNPQVNQVLVFTTAEGNRGVMKIDAINPGTSMTITYRVYNDSSTC